VAVTISFILLLVFSLISAGILNANSNIGADAFAKKSSKTSPNIESNVRNGLGDGGGSGRDGPSSTTGNSDIHGTKATVPPVQIATSNNINNNDKFVIINFDDSHESEHTYAKPILDKYGNIAVASLRSAIG
jgi:hypothetical protein